MFTSQTLKLVIPIILEYIVEFINPAAKEKRTTKGERLVAIVIALLVLCLGTLLDKTVGIAKELEIAKITAKQNKELLAEREDLIGNIKFYLDRCDGQIDELQAELNSCYQEPNPVFENPTINIELPDVEERSDSKNNKNHKKGSEEDRGKDVLLDMISGG